MNSLFYLILALQLPWINCGGVIPCDKVPTFEVMGLFPELYDNGNVRFLTAQWIEANSHNQDLRYCIYNYTIVATDQEGNVYANESILSHLVCNNKLCSYTFTNLIPPTQICSVTVTASLEENSPQVLTLYLGREADAVNAMAVPKYFDAQLISLEVSWIERPRIPVVYSVCSHTTIYIVSVENLHGIEVAKKNASSEHCNEKYQCLTSVPIETLNTPTYRVAVQAMGGDGNESYSAAAYSGFYATALPDFTINFSSQHCTTTVGCYTSLPANTSIHCNISYGKLSPSNHLPGSPIVLKVNSSSRIPLSGFRSIHYEVTANLSSNRTVIFHRVTNTMNRFPPRLMGLNSGLIGFGALFAGVAIIICIIVSVVQQNSLRKNRYASKTSISYWLPLILWLLSVTFVMMCVITWIGMGYQVNFQEDTCDPNWMSTRDILVILVFLLSILAFGFVVATAFVVGSCFMKYRNQPDNTVIAAPPPTPFDFMIPLYDGSPYDAAYDHAPSFIDIGEDSVYSADYWDDEGGQSDPRSYRQDVYSHQDNGREHTHEGHVYPGASPHNSRSVYI